MNTNNIIKRNENRNNWFPSLMDDFLNPTFFNAFDKAKMNMPAVNVINNEKDFEIEMAVPGKKKEDFNIEVEGDMLVISSEQKHTDEQKEKNYTRREFSFSSFKRSFSLPENVETDQIGASYADGVLKIVIPKREEKQAQKKTISID